MLELQKCAKMNSTVNGHLQTLLLRSLQFRNRYAHSWHKILSSSKAANTRSETIHQHNIQVMMFITLMCGKSKNNNRNVMPDSLSVSNHPQN